MPSTKTVTVTKTQNSKGKKKIRKQKSRNNRRITRRTYGIPQEIDTSYAKAWTSFSQKMMGSSQLQEAATAMVLPEKASRCPFDSTRAGGQTALECVTLQTAFSYDFFTLYNELASGLARCEVNTPVGESVPLFPPGAVPIMHFHDPYCPLMMPARSPANPVPGTPRAWTARMSTNPVEKIVPNPASRTPFQMVARSPLTAVGSSTTMLPPEFRSRPITRRRLASANVEYFWIDATRATPSAVNLITTVLLTSSVPIVAGTVGAQLTTVFLGLDGEEQSSSNTTATVLPLVPSGAQWTAVLTTTDSISTSGYYRFIVEITYPAVDLGAIYTGLQVSSVLAVEEFVLIGAGFLIDPNFATLTGLTQRYWNPASSLLVSFMSPPLVAGGTIFGCNVVPWRDFVEPLALGDLRARTIAPIEEQCNGMMGNHLTKGIYVWEKQRVQPTALLDSSMDLPFLSSTLVAERPPIAYLIGAAGGFDGGSIIWVDPSATQAGATVVLRLQTTSLLAYQPRNKIIKPTSGPIFLLPDETAALTHILLSASNFSENDWHEFFGKVAKVASRVARYLVNAHELLSGNPKAAAAIAADAMADFSVFRVRKNNLRHKSTTQS